MKSVDIENTSLDNCVTCAQGEPLVVTRAGHPVALIVGVEGLDSEQVELGSSGNFWQLITERRKQPTISRAELDRRLSAHLPSEPPATTDT
jgi:antitoxin (DNA-binding transcriptional repressor) of toxin-antitoxin stability system